MNIKYKEEYLKNEFHILLDKNPKLVYIVLYFADFFDDITITSIYRNQEGTVHKFWRGLDLRIRDLNLIMVEVVVDLINKLFPYGKGEIKTALIHDVGQGLHLHLQTKA